MKVSDLRYNNILPSPDLEKPIIKGIKVKNKKKFLKEDKWWKYERELETTEYLEQDQLLKLCDACGECCKNIPTRNIGMYAVGKEIDKINAQVGKDWIAGTIKINNKKIALIKVKTNGNCYFLKRKKCQIHNIKPNWCKMWVCEKMKEVYDG